MPSFCSRPGSDAIRDAFCDATPQIRSLRDLQDLLGVNPVAQAREPGEQNARDVDVYAIVTVAVFLGHSTALPGRLVSPINPRAILLGADNAVAFQRGLQSVEIATRARDRGDFNFYLLSFEQACNRRKGGCSSGDLYTPSVEQDWTSVRIEDDEDLKNTPSDCRQCHRRARETSQLLMRELESPWTHFFEPDRDNAPGSELPGVRGRDLVQDYLRAKGDEPYGQILVSNIRQSIGLVLENTVGADQPLIFDAPRIEDDRWPYGPDGYPSEPRRSETWDSAYEAFQRGEQLALPHYEPRPTDPTKQAELTAAYQRYRSGELSASELPDLSDIFPDDEEVRAEIGLQTKPGATPAEVLIQACGSCHNDVLDQTISRARFNIDLARMDEAELSLAIERIELPPTAPGVMPPPEGRQIAESAQKPLLEYLRRHRRSAADDALLARAAKLGMAGQSGASGAADPR